jgi:hypothetical protein
MAASDSIEKIIQRKLRNYLQRKDYSKKLPSIYKANVDLESDLHSSNSFQ